MRGVIGSRAALAALCLAGAYGSRPLERPTKISAAGCRFTAANLHWRRQDAMPREGVPAGWASSANKKCARRVAIIEMRFDDAIEAGHRQHVARPSPNVEADGHEARLRIGRARRGNGARVDVDINA